MAWIAPTYALALEFSDLALELNASVLCPCCGRRTNADMLIDLRGVPSETRATWGIAGAFCCDACRERAFREGRVARVDFYRELGAPPDLLERLT
jgi:hypothetical protein